MDTHDELEPLAERALGGDRAALDALCRALQGPLYRLALRVFGRNEEARDATQEALVLVVTHLSQFRAESRLLTWAYSVATRHFLRARARTARSRSVEELAGLIEAGLGVAGPAAQPEGDARVLARETGLQCTQAMLECLSFDERVALVLSEVLGADDALGARLCEVEPATYRKRLSRARARLAPVLRGLCGLADPALPCSCARQAAAKQTAGLERRAWTKLPLAVDPERVRAAAERLGALRRLGPVFAVEPPIAAPEDLWDQLRARVPALLGE